MPVALATAWTICWHISASKLYKVIHDNKISDNTDVLLIHIHVLGSAPAKPIAFLWLFLLIATAKICVLLITGPQLAHAPPGIHTYVNLHYMFLTQVYNFKHKSI